MCSFKAILPKFQNCLLDNKTNFLLSFTEFAWDMAIRTFQISQVCVLPDRLILSSKETCPVLFYIILPSLIKVSNELLEIIAVNSHTQTHRHNGADENNTCSKTKFLGQLKTPYFFFLKLSCSALFSQEKKKNVFAELIFHWTNLSRLDISAIFPKNRKMHEKFQQAKKAHCTIYYILFEIFQNTL